MREVGVGRRGGMRAGLVQARERLAIGYAVAALLGFLALLAVVLLGDPLALDRQVTLALQGWRSPLLLQALVAVSWLGFQPQATVIAGAILLALLAGRRFLEAGFAALAFLSQFLSGPLKLLANRPRPSAALDGIVVYGQVGGASFPSGHVLTYTVICGFLAYLAFTRVRRVVLRRLALAPPLALIALVGPSRVYLGQHWFLDVLASYLLGSALLIGILALFRRVTNRRRALARAREAGYTGSKV